MVNLIICVDCSVFSVTFSAKIALFFKRCLSSVGNAACKPDTYILIDICLSYPQNIVVIFLPMGRGGSIVGHCSICVGLFVVPWTIRTIAGLPFVHLYHVVPLLNCAGFTSRHTENLRYLLSK